MNENIFLIDFVIPQFKDPRVIRAIKSIVCHKDSNLFRIIIQDGSLDGGISDEIKKHLRRQDIYINERDFGIFDAINKGMSRVNSPWIGWMGADDMLSPNFDLSPIIEADSAVGFISYITLFFKDGKSYASRVYKPLSCRFLRKFGCHVPHFSTFVKASVVKETRFDKDVKVFADQLFFFELEDKTRGVISNSCATFMAEGGTSNSSIWQILGTNLEIYKLFSKKIGRFHALLYVVVKLIYKVEQRLNAMIFKREVVYPE